MKNITVIGVIVLMGLIACSKTEPPPSAEKHTTINVPLELATPDKALKTYWAVRDSVGVKLTEEYTMTADRAKVAQSQLGMVVDAPLLKSLTAFNLTPETFSRDILEVKVESESRAVIVAVIKNTTPLPAGGEMSKFDEERRRDGERYRYVLEKGQTGWRVSEIWGWDTYPSPGYSKKHPRDGKPYIPSLTYDGV